AEAAPALGLVDLDLVEVRHSSTVDHPLGEPDRAHAPAVVLDDEQPVARRLQAVRQGQGIVAIGLGPGSSRLHPGELHHLPHVALAPVLGEGAELVLAHRPQLDAHSATRWNRMWSRQSPAMRRYRGATPIRTKPFFSSTRWDARLSTSVPASRRCSPIRPNACSIASPTARVATPRPFTSWATK